MRHLNKFKIWHLNWRLLTKNTKHADKQFNFSSLTIRNHWSEVRLKREVPRLVMPLRFERRTYALEGRCSIQLSYGTRVKKMLDNLIFVRLRNVMRSVAKEMAQVMENKALSLKK